MTASYESLFESLQLKALDKGISGQRVKIFLVKQNQWAAPQFLSRT